MSSELRVDKIVPVDGVAANSGNISYGGGIVQVVYNQINSSLGQYSSNSTSYNDTGHDVLITPKFATSTLVVHASAHVYVNTNAYPSCFFGFYRDGSAISEHNTAITGGYVQVNTGQLGAFIPFIYAEESANNTSSTTFSLYVKSNTGGNNSQFNDTANRWLAVMEIAQ